MPHSHIIPRRRRTAALAAAFPAFFLLLLFSVGCPGKNAQQGGRPPAPSSRDYGKYRDTVQAFYVGLIKMETDTAGADKELTRVTQLAPEEPAGWANLGIYQMRKNQPDEAAKNFSKALELTRDDTAKARIEGLLGLLASRQGNPDEAIKRLRSAVERDPNNLRAAYALAKEVDRKGGEGSEAEYARLLDAVLEKQPENLAVLLESARAAARRGDATALQERVAAVAQQANGWPAQAQQQLQALQVAAKGANPRAAATRVLALTNVIRPLPAYQQSAAAVEPPENQIGEPFERFLVLANPDPSPSAPDTGLTYAASTDKGVSGKAVMAGVFFPGSKHNRQQRPSTPEPIPSGQQERPVAFAADAQSVRLPGGVTVAFPGKGTPPTMSGVVPIDFNYDFRTDLVLAGAGGIRLYAQKAPNQFTDVTPAAKILGGVVNDAYHGAWAADIEADGDLDIVAATVNSQTVFLRNNGDGTFQPEQGFPRVTGARGFAWGDFDTDGDPDAAVLDQAGGVYTFTNERSGRFTERAKLPLTGKATALTMADANRDGVLDIIALMENGTIMRISDKGQGAEWDTAEMGTADLLGANHIFAAEMDNNGSVDLVVSGSQGSAVLLSDESGKFTQLLTTVDGVAQGAADMNDDGLPDLIALSSTGEARTLTGKATKKYNWQKAQPLSDPLQPAQGNKRINSFGIGGEIELRADLLYQKMPITAPVVHFGLGERTQADALRAIWPNGTVNAGFALKNDVALYLPQNLKGSCPYLFAWNGKEMAFITDCIWRSPLGLKINAQDTAGVAQTQDWIKLRGDQVVPTKEGVYDLRVTAELWETHFFDHLSLMAVDHPEDTEIWIDERLAFPQPPLEVIATRAPRPVARAVNDSGDDASALVAERDGIYVDNFGRGQYQGVTRDHYLEVELPKDAPADKPLYLIAHGWIHPTDSSINVAIGQGKGNPAPMGLRLETPDGRGGWRVARPGLGFPTGKVKTIVLNLGGIWKPGESDRRLRLRTNLEIFWDQITWAEAPKIDPASATALMRTRRIAAKGAELRYRGFSLITAKDQSSPELPESYEGLAGTAPRWRDLEGHYTRFGDVKPLLGRIDDRYVIMNAGDEMRLTFAALPAPPRGWKRDFVLIGDGWVKDGDYNTQFSKTVMPLPMHKQADYSTPPTHLEDDPAYRRNKADWETYHTRYVAPQGFGYALRPRQNQSEQSSRISKTRSSKAVQR